MEQKALQRKVNYIAPTLNTKSESETAYKQIRVAAYCRVSTQMEEQLNSYEVQVKHYTDKINSEPVFCRNLCRQRYIGNKRKKAG